MGFTYATAWQLDADATTVFDILADVETYPSWWPQVRAARRLEDGLGELRCRSLLPFDVTFRMRREIEDRDTGLLRGHMEGDLTGTSEWRVTPDGGHRCRVQFQQDVGMGGGLFGAAARLARPALKLNHQRMMRDAESGLRRLLAGAVSS